MKYLPATSSTVLAALLSLLAALGPAAPVQAGDVTAFVALPFPRDNWGTGYGAAISSTWFKVLSFEGEAARMGGKRPDADMTSFTASALLAPPIGGLTPYGGLGFGLFRQTLGPAADTGKLAALILGAKVNVKGLVVFKAEYRRLDLSGEPLLKMDSRLSAGAGLIF